MKLAVTLLTISALIAVIGCASQPDLGDPYTAADLILAHSESAETYEEQWKGQRINIEGAVLRASDGRVYLDAADSGLPGAVALSGLSEDEQTRWDPGDRAEYACTIGEYVNETILMEQCGPAEHGGDAAASSAAGSGAASSSSNPIVQYWSIPALLIASVLTVTAMARSTWKGWHPPMIAVMCLGVLAILNAVAAAVFSYTTVDSSALIVLAALSFPVICALAWLILDPDRFPSLDLGGVGTSAPMPSPVSMTQAQPDSTSSAPDMTNVGVAGTVVGPPRSPIVEAPSQTMAMQPNVTRSMAWVVVTKGPSEGKSIQLKEGANTIGRALDNDLQVDDASVSRAHAMLTVKDGEFTLIDLGSAGGTRIGAYRISGKRVGAGSVVAVGQTALSLVGVDAFQGGPASGATMVGSPSGSSLTLIAQSGPDAGKSFLLASAQNVIGRDASAQVVLSDPTVSRRHAMIRVDADRVSISDLGSMSGTSVDGEVIQGVRIAVGDRVAIGQSEFTLMMPSV